MAVWTVIGEAAKALDATERSLETLGWESPRLIQPSLGIEELTFNVPLTSADGAGAYLPEERQVVILKQSGTVVFRGHVLRKRYLSGGGSPSVEYGVLGPAWWMANADISSEIDDEEGTPADRQQFSFGATGSKYIGDYVSGLFARAVALGLPVALDSTWAAAKFFEYPRITLSLMSFADALAELLRPVADVVTWWDHSVSPPEFHAARRADLAATAYTLGTAPLVEAELNPILANEVSEVVVSSVSRDATTGATQWTEETAGAYAAGRRQIITISGPELTDQLPSTLLQSYDLETADYGTAATRWRDFLTDFDERFAAIVELEGAWPGGLQVLPSTFSADDSPLAKGSLTTEASGNRIWLPESLALYDDGTAETSFADLNRFVPAGIRPPSWLLDDAAGKARRATLRLYWYVVMPDTPSQDAWEDQIVLIASPEGHKFNAAETIDYGYVSVSGDLDPAPGVFTKRVYGKTEVEAYICDAEYATPTAVYRSADYDFASPPAGLAANLKSAQDFIPYEGRLVLEEDPHPTGNLLARKYNVAGALAAHATAAALPSRVIHEIGEHKVTIDLGPPARFDFATLVQRIRRTPQDNIVPISP